MGKDKYQSSPGKETYTPFGLISESLENGLFPLLSLKAELEPLKEQLRGAQELAASSQQKAVLLGEELASAAGARDRTIAELHRSRLEVAGVNGRLAELNLHLKEEKSQWSKERAGLLQNVEVGGNEEIAGFLCVVRVPRGKIKGESLGVQGFWVGKGYERRPVSVQCGLLLTQVPLCSLAKHFVWLPSFCWGATP